MSHAFRELLKKVGSGPHTSENLTRPEAAEALRAMLLQEAKPAQIGAFLIAHRIKRPTGEELAGMLDTYEALGPKLLPLSRRYHTAILGSPYDGRSRTAPISPLTALILACCEVPVILHGGERMPTKYGVPLLEVWQGLGVEWGDLSLAQVQQVLEATGVGFVYLPQHFPVAHAFVEYRDQIGKRPPIATMELMWCPYAGDKHLFAGYVHPPTENMFKTCLELRGMEQFTTVKGLEGSCDLSRDRTAIIGCYVPEIQDFERILLHPRDYELAGADVPFHSTPELIDQMRAVLQAEAGELLKSAIWNGGFYLWRSQVCPDLESGLAHAERLIVSGQVRDKLVQLATQVESQRLNYSAHP
ncbi:anthranilate phosphoribosyltransferase family protein [Geitlerinema calcuttense]|uniref:Anthranilate phosphoribosyltransferase family protein n=1 Tax=Geitlerinema calcuttense NRMC-F 0142 TaxID=2922238 RepID=A0ABT7LXM0_9CYAN|nr:anthranilate phosphoribosyltransferase family protein [Geitlerinema calcuttense]MDL5056749.1 anthranilate phosphoribosyltransferase family protein [Geitlerinema calcuttense NRMC-F 0142]